MREKQNSSREGIMREKQNSSSSDGCKVSFILFVKMYFGTRI